MALRDQLRQAAAWDRLPGECYGGRDTRFILDVALGVPSAEAAAYQVQYLKELADDRNVLVQAARHVARYGTPTATKWLLDFVRSSRPDDLGAYIVHFSVQTLAYLVCVEAVKRWFYRRYGRLLAPPARNAA